MFGTSAFLRMFHKEAPYKAYNAGQHLEMYNWAVENCQKLNISEIADDWADNFEPGCYHFVGHMRIEGNLTLPPLDDTTECPSLMGIQYISSYGRYLAKQCNFNGQHQECASYNPACQVDLNNGLGYEARYGWVPNPDSISEFYHGNSENYEFDLWLQQTEEWKEAAARNRMGMFTINYEHCSKLGAGGTSMCSSDFQAPDTHFMNNTRVLGWVDELMGAIYYEMGGFWQYNDPEHLPIYDIGKGPGTNAIHFNGFRAFEDAMINLRAETTAKQRAKYPDWNNLEHFHPLNVPVDTTPHFGYNNFRDLEIVMMQRQQIYYAPYLVATGHEFGRILNKYREKLAISEGRWFTPTAHPYGPIVHSPNALGDTFYADPDMEEARLNGTTRTNAMFEFLNEPSTYYPFAFSEEVWDKMRANGGKFTDAEFKALPEYGDPAHFPLVANETRWAGGNNCWHEEGHMFTQKYPMNARKFSPYCRMEEPTDFPLEFIGMVHKKTNTKTGQPMLVWNAIAMSNNTNNGVHNDMSKIESASSINQLPSDLKRFNERSAALYPDIWVMVTLLDYSMRGMVFYGAEWYSNGAEKSEWGRVLLYYITWLYPNDPFLMQFNVYDPENPIFADMETKAAFAIKEFRNAWYILYIMAIMFWAITAMISLFESRVKRSSEES